MVEGANAAEAVAEPPSDAAELAGLVAAAKLPKADPVSPPESDPHRPPTVADLAREAEASVAASWLDPAGPRDDALRWADWVLGPDAAPDEREALARRRTSALRFGLAIADRPELSAAADVEGAGVAQLASVNEGVIIGFLHTGAITALGYSLPQRLGRTLYWPDGSHASPPVPGSATSGIVGRRVRAYAEAAGVRFVGPRRRLDVMGELVNEQGACVFAVDAFGHGRGRLLDQEVLTTTGPAVLAQRTGAPIVLVHTYRDRDRMKVVACRPLRFPRDASTEAIHAGLIELADARLRMDPGQLLVRFPARALVAANQERAKLEAEMPRLEREFARARSEYDGSRRALAASPASKTAIEGERRARRELKRRRSALRDGQAELRRVRTLARG